MAKFLGQWIVLKLVIGCVAVNWLLCRVSCVIVTVTRQEKDIFTNPVLSTTDCSSKYASACKKRNAHAYSEKLDGKCACQCKYFYSTFFKTDLTLKCVDNLKMRNKTHITDKWIYLLPRSYLIGRLGGPVAVLNLTFQTDRIEFKINGHFILGNNIVQRCNAYKVEVANINGIWSQISSQFESMKINVSSVEYKDASANLTLNWKFNQSFINDFNGKIMRIRIECHQGHNMKGPTTSAPRRSVIDDFIIFKISGTFEADIPEASSDSSTYYVIPSSSASTPSEYPSTSTLTMSSSLLHVHSVSTSSNQMTILAFSSSPVLTSIRITSTIQSIPPTTHSIPPTTHSIPPTTHSIPPTTTLTVTKLPSFSVSSSTITSSSSVISSNPQKQSNDSSVTKAVTGAVVGVILVLVVMAVLFYVLRRRKQRKKSGNSYHGKANGTFIDKTIGNVPLPALSNPVFQEGTYENPEVHDDKKRQSGTINHIGSALYDQCLVVENPGARSVSVYDNIAKQENAYQALDPTKREPSAKYQSLIKPNDESSAPVSESSSPEPVYSVVDDAPSRHLKTTSDNQAKAYSGTRVEPLYNVLEVDGAEAMTTEDDHVYTILEQSKESEGKREPVYSVLEGEEK